MARNVGAKVALPPRVIDTLRAAENIVPGADADITQLELSRLKGTSFDVTRAVTGAELERTIDGASTITVSLHDPDRKLLRSGLFESAVDIELDGLAFRLVAVSKSDDELQLTFEERAVALLRKKDKPLKVSRDQVSRAQFVKRLVDEVKTYPIGFYSPDVKEPKKDKKKTPTKRAATKSKGVAKAANITIKGSKASSEQLNVINRVMDAATENNASPRALLALVAMIIQECEFRNIQGAGADAVSFGVIQAIPGTSSGIKGTFTRRQAYDIEYSVESILKHSTTGFENNKGGGLNGVARRHPDWTIGRIAAMVNNGVVNGTSGAPAYVNGVNSHKREAQKIIDAYGSGETGSGQPSGKYEFSRGRAGEPEDSWTCIQRLAEEVNYRAFCSANTIYFINDEDLIASQPQLVLAEFDPGVMSIDFDFDAGKRVQEATVVIRTKRWRVNPGAVVELQDTGPADGRWLVQSFRRSLVDPEATLELRRASKPLPEPKGESTGEAGVRGAGGASTDGLNGIRLGSAWGGTQSIFEQFVNPFMRKQGLPVGSQKRTPQQNAAVGGAQGSDHLTSQTNAYAVDYPTRNGAAAATALARAMGQRSWRPGTFNRFNITVSGKSFSVQILWAVQGHYDHVHVGIRRA